MISTQVLLLLLLELNPDGVQHTPRQVLGLQPSKLAALMQGHAKQPRESYTWASTSNNGWSQCKGQQLSISRAGAAHRAAAAHVQCVGTLGMLQMAAQEPHPTRKAPQAAAQCRWLGSEE